MTAKTELSAPKRRTRAEVQQLVAEFVSSGMRRSEFCQSRGLSLSTLDRHLRKLRWKRRRKPLSSAGRLVPVESDRSCCTCVPTLGQLSTGEVDSSCNHRRNNIRACGSKHSVARIN